MTKMKNTRKMLAYLDLMMNLKKKDGLLIACINRNGEIIFPRGHDMIKAGDRVIVVTTHTGFGDISDILEER